MVLSKKAVQITLLFICFFPVIDWLNGFFIYLGFSSSIGSMYRLACFFLLLFMIIRKGFYFRSYDVFTILLFCSIWLLSLAQTITLGNDQSSLAYDLSNLVKLSFWIGIPYFVYQNKEQITASFFERLFMMISSFFVSGLLVPYLLGIGKSTYVGAGFKGFFLQRMIQQ
ncbi:hypothetical protein [Listeria sp. PSOL-1]|uniref:hypothetical protein n=1 Tax=Listeria sp. PSOL-1 TaxID=1844999 RepID=UPI0013D539E3|nr:hypothetical protein [Listeria sp. PSOL-1]